MPTGPQSLRLILLLVSPRRTGVAANRVVGIGPALLSGLVLRLLVLVLIVTAVLLVVSGMLAGLLDTRWGSRRLAELSFAGLFPFVATAWGVLLVTLRSRLMCYLLVPVMLVVRVVLSTFALLAIVGRVGLVLLVVERFVGAVVFSCHCKSRVSAVVCERYVTSRATSRRGARPPPGFERSCVLPWRGSCRRVRCVPDGHGPREWRGPHRTPRRFRRIAPCW